MNRLFLELSTLYFQILKVTKIAEIKTADGVGEPL